MLGRLDKAVLPMAFALGVSGSPTRASEAPPVMYWQANGTCNILVTGPDTFVKSAITNTPILQISPCDPDTDLPNPAHYSVKIGVMPGSILVTTHRTYCMWMNSDGEMTFGPSNCMGEEHLPRQTSSRRSKHQD